MTHPPTPKATRSTRATTRRLQKQTKEEFLREIAAQIPEDLSEAEAVGILLGRLETARRAFRSARLRQGMREVGVDFLPIPDAHNSTLPAPVPPKAILSYLNRSRIWPCLVPPEPTSKVPLTELLQVIRDRHRSGEPWYRLLDLLVTGAGMPWQSGAKILRNLTGQIIEDDDFTMVAQARSFWVHFGEGRARLFILAKAQDITLPGAGDWAHFERSQLESILPGAIWPDHCQRREYLVNFIHDPQEARLDLYSPSGLGLCRHPFPAAFNPVSFGRVPAKTIRDRP